jgi:hypothetical protein
VETHSLKRKKETRLVNAWTPSIFSLHGKKEKKKKARPVSEGWGEDVVLLRCGWADEGATAVGGRAIAKSSQRNYFRTLLETLLFVVVLRNS